LGVFLDLRCHPYAGSAVFLPAWLQPARDCPAVFVTRAFGIITNLISGWIGARLGLNLTMHTGRGLQVLALLMFTVPDPWLSVPYVMAVQALSGIAKDLNKMSAKASIKLMLLDSSANADSIMFKWVSLLTGSKNALKGEGYFLGDYRLSVWVSRACASGRTLVMPLPSNAAWQARRQTVI